MQDASPDDIAYLRSLFDQPDNFALAAWDVATNADGKLDFEYKELFDVIARTFAVLNTREDTDAFEMDLAPIDKFRILSVFKDRRFVMAEGVTPREFYRLAKDFTETIKQSHKLYVVTGDISYAWLRTDLAEDDAILHMLMHSDQVRADLGLPAYDHSQW